MEWLTIHDGEQRATLVERRENDWLLVELEEDGPSGPRGRQIQVKEKFATFDDQQMTPPGSPMSSPQAPGHFDSPPKDMVPVETLCEGSGVARTKDDKPDMTSPVKGQPRADQGNPVLSPSRPGAVVKAQNLSTARTDLKQGFVHVVECMIRGLQVGSCSEETLLNLSDASVSLRNMRCVCHALSQKVSLDGLRAVSIPTKPPEEPSQTAAWCLKQDSIKTLRRFFQGNFPDEDIDEKDKAELQTHAAELVSTRGQQRLEWGGDPPKAPVLMRCAPALATCGCCGCLLDELVSVTWRPVKGSIGRGEFEPVITPIETTSEDGPTLCFTSDGKGPHHAEGKELLEAMGCVDRNSIPTHDALVQARPSAAHALLRAVCNSGSSGVDQSNSYEAQARLIALESSRKLRMRVVGLSSLSEHACTGPSFFFKDSDDTDAVVEKLHRFWVVLDRDGFTSKKKHPWWSNDRQRKLCVRHVTLDALVRDTELFREVSVTLPASSVALRGAQLRCPDVREEHLVCYLVKVRHAFQIKEAQIKSSNRSKQAWQRQLSAHFLEQFAWPPDSSSLASLTLNYSQSRSKAFLQAAALAGRGF